MRVEHGRIVSVGRSAEQTTYNLAGATLTPGWIDTHAHLDPHFASNGRPTSEANQAVRAPDETPAQRILYAAENAWLTLQSGFTTIQTLGAELDVDLRSAIGHGVLPGPRIISSVRQVARTGSNFSEEELRRQVRDAQMKGADLIKVFASAMQWKMQLLPVVRNSNMASSQRTMFCA